MNNEKTLTCIKVSENELAFTNCVYISYQHYHSIAMIARDIPIYVFVNDKAFTAKGHNKLSLDEIAINGIHRESCGFELGQQLIVKRCLDKLPTVCMAKLSVEYRSKTRAYLKETDVTDELHKEPRVLNKGQKFAIRLNSGHVLACTVLKFERFGEEMVTEPIEFGITDQCTIYEFDIQHNVLLKWECARGRIGGGIRAVDSSFLGGWRV